MSSVTAGTLLAAAAKEVGTREGRDKNGNWNNRVKYNDWYANHPLIKDSGFLTTAWCAVFVSWVANQVGVLGSLIPMHAWTPSGLAWFQKRGLVTRGKGAKVGDVFYVYYPSQGRVAHVGLVERVEGNYIYTIEGNTNTTGSRQGNGVYRLKRAINNNLYFCHPTYGSAPKPPAPKPVVKPSVSRAGVVKAAKTNPAMKGRPVTDKTVKALEDALVRAGLLSSKYADGHYGTTTIAAYKKWQIKCGFKGSDADGIPPAKAAKNDSLTRLAVAYGFTITK